MTKVRLTKGKFAGISACADAHGVIAALAMDQRGSLQKMLAAAMPAGRAASDEDLIRFKAAVTEVLSPHASAILLDPEYGLPATKERAPNAGVLLAYEKTGYDAAVPGRLPDLLDHLLDGGCGRIVEYCGSLDGEVHRGADHARHRMQRPFHTCRARSAVHPLDAERHLVLGVPSLRNRAHPIYMLTPGAGGFKRNRPNALTRQRPSMAEAGEMIINTLCPSGRRYPVHRDVSQRPFR